MFAFLGSYYVEVVEMRIRELVKKLENLMNKTMLQTVWARYRAGQYQGLFLLMPDINELMAGMLYEQERWWLDRIVRQRPLWDRFRLSEEEAAEVPGKYLRIKIDHNFKPKAGVE